MEIKELNSEEIDIYKSNIFALLIDTYTINFQVPLEQVKQICSDKIELLSSYINQGSALVIAAIKENELLGFIWLYKHDYMGEQRLHVNQVAVNKEHRGKRIGKSLMLEAEKQAMKAGIQTIDLFVSEGNTKALALYENLDFETERRYMKKKL